MKRWILAVVALVVVAAIVAGCSPKAQPTTTVTTTKPGTTATATATATTTATATATTTIQPITLKIASFIPLPDQSTQAHQFFTEQVTKKTNGRIQFKTEWATIGGALDMLPMVRSGAVDMAALQPAYYGGEMPFLSGPTSIYAYRSYVEALQVANRMTNENPQTAAILQKDAAKHNLKLLNWIATPMYLAITKKPVSTLADLKGIKMRSMGEYLPKIETALGMTPVTSNPADWYDALSKGVIDGVPLPTNTSAMYKLNEVAKNVSFEFGSSPGSPLFINLNTWNKLSASEQKIMSEMWKEQVAFEISIIDKELAAVKNLYTWNTVPKAEQDQIYALWEAQQDAWVEKMKGLGQGDDAAAVLKVWREMAKEYRK